MKTKSLLTLLLFLFSVVACGGEKEGEQPLQAVADIEEGVEETSEEVVVAESSEGESNLAPAATRLAPATGEGTLPLAPQPEGRLIVKEAEMNLLVENTDVAVNRVTDISVGAGGYMLSQRVWDDQQGYRHASLTLGVPVARFERVLQQLRRLGEVTDETASGDDVTEEYVDLDSRLATLRTTHARLLSFLEEAETVEEILALNERIAEVESQLSQIQGRMNYLSNRAAYSTVTVNLEPNIPVVTPTPTLTPTPWTPGATVRKATGELRDTAQGILSFLIYYGIVCGPWLLLVLPLGYGGWRLFRRADTRLPGPARDEGEGAG